MKIRLMTMAALVLGFAAALTHHTAASIPPAPRGITLSPAIVQAQVTPNEEQHKLDFKITNNKTTTQTINLTTADFNTLGESGGLVFVGANPSQIQKKYGLATWLALPQTTITVQPKQSASLTAFILNQPSLAPGGHYGALMLSLADKPASSTSKNKVSVHPVASSLLFVDKQGGDTHKLRLSNVYVSHSIFSLPSSVTLRFHNDGNTHLIPRGVVTVSGPNGKLVSRGIINENSAITLPETFRRYTVPLTKIAAATHPGKYKIEVDYRFDGYDQFRSYRTSVFLLAQGLIITIVIFLAAAVGITFYILKNPKAKKVIRKRLKR
jgi:hypothetical protein